MDARHLAARGPQPSASSRPRHPAHARPPAPLHRPHPANPQPCPTLSTSARASSALPVAAAAPPPPPYCRSRLSRARVACSALPGAAAAPPSLPYWRSHLSRQPLLLPALLECLEAIRAQGPLPEAPDVALVYLGSKYEADYGLLVDSLRQQLPGLKNVFGCTGFGIIGVDAGGAHEVEAAPALSLTLAALPEAEVVVRHVEQAELPDGDASPERWSALLGVPAFPELPLSLVVLSDPTFGGVQDLLAGLDFAFPEATKIGGLSSSSAFAGGGTATFCWSSAPPPPLAPATGQQQAGAGSTVATTASSTPGTASDGPSTSTSSTSGTSSTSSGSSGSGLGLYRRGASVMCIHGEVQLDLMIAQGCRPLTLTTWTVDRVSPTDPTRIVALAPEGGRPLPALEAFQKELQSVLGGMNEVQLRRTVSNLTVGLAPAGTAQPLEPQDFLIRALRGFDADQSLVVGDYVRAGQRVRFMVRDKQGAQEDLASHGLAFKRKQLQAMMTGGPSQPPPPFGMLMFTCNGRGSGLYGEESYDARTMAEYVPVPCAGFQCNGEIGRVGSTTHLHGFTCAVGVLRSTASASQQGRGGVSVSVAEAAAGAARAAPAAAADPKQQSAEGQGQAQGEEVGREGAGGASTQEGA